jgi:hypothetical protein
MKGTFLLNYQGDINTELQQERRDRTIRHPGDETVLQISARGR